MMLFTLGDSHHIINGKYRCRHNILSSQTKWHLSEPRIKLCAHQALPSDSHIKHSRWQALLIYYLVKTSPVFQGCLTGSVKKSALQEAICFGRCTKAGEVCWLLLVLCSVLLTELACSQASIPDKRKPQLEMPAKKVCWSRRCQQKNVIFTVAAGLDHRLCPHQQNVVKNCLSPNRVRCLLSQSVSTRYCWTTISCDTGSPRSLQWFYSLHPWLEENNHCPGWLLLCSETIVDANLQQPSFLVGCDDDDHVISVEYTGKEACTWWGG